MSEEDVKIVSELLSRRPIWRRWTRSQRSCRSVIHVSQRRRRLDAGTVRAKTACNHVARGLVRSLRRVTGWRSRSPRDGATACRLVATTRHAGRASGTEVEQPRRRRLWTLARTEGSSSKISFDGRRRPSKPPGCRSRRCRRRTSRLLRSYTTLEPVATSEVVTGLRPGALSGTSHPDFVLKAVPLSGPYKGLRRPSFIQDVIRPGTPLGARLLDETH